MDVDSDIDRRRLQALLMWIWRRMQKISWLAKVINEEVIRRQAIDKGNLTD